MNNTTITPLARGEEHIWLNCCPDPERDQKDLAFFEKNAEPLAFLIARVGQEPVGKLKGIAGQGTCFISHISVEKDADYAQTAGALISYITSSGKYPRVFARTNTPQPGAFDAALEKAGFELLIERTFVAKDITDYKSPYADNFDYRPLKEAGQELFIKILAETMMKGPVRPSQWKREPDFAANFAQMLQYGGRDHAMISWKMAFLGDEPAGMVFPQPDPDNSKSGMVLYVAVAEKFRGRGFGKILHAKGLADLAIMGSKHHTGSTDSINRPMLRIFDRNGCRKTGAISRDYVITV